MPYFIITFKMLFGRDPMLASVNTALLYSTLLLLMATSPELSWIMETWAVCPSAKTCAVNHTSVMWLFWRENAVFPCTAITRRSASGCRRKTTSTFYSFLTSLASAVLQTAVSHLEAMHHNAPDNA